MIFADDNAIFTYIKANQKVSKQINAARVYTRKWSALYDGDDFANVLISQILGIEGQKKAVIRTKYARDIRDFFARISVPRQNVWSATGGSKDYDYGQYKLTDDAKAELLSFVTDTRDNKSITEYLATVWDKLVHTDPSGVLYVEAQADDEGTTDMYPTYKSIINIRHYIANGQMTECILFEPVLTKNTSNKTVKTWRVADDINEYSVIQDGDTFTINPDDTKTFAHEFGWCPALIMSGITDKFGNRLSPYYEIEGVAEEYARDLSVKTIYKFLHGFPKSYQMRMACGTCKGIKKSGEKCKECDDTGFRKGDTDVADVMIFPFPEDKDAPQLDPKSVMGYFAPSIETWDKMDGNLDRNFDEAYESIWGIKPMVKVVKTATETVLDLQPMINKLVEYSKTAQWLEHTLTEMYANRLNLNKDKDIPVSSIIYGTMYILEGLDTILKKYYDAKTANAPIGILDALYDQILILKYKDPVYYDLMVKKSLLEPHKHLGIVETGDMYSATEALKKEFFSPWWKKVETTGDAVKKEVEDLAKDFDSAFAIYLPTVTINTPVAVALPIPGTPEPAKAA